MSVTKRYCPKCGTANPGAARFCRSCGEHFTEAPEDAEKTLQKAAEVVNNVSSTVSQAESTVNAAGQAARAAGAVTRMVVQPPAKWDVVVGEMPPEIGKKILETGVSVAGDKIEQEVKRMVQEEATRQPPKSGPGPQGMQLLPQQAPPSPPSRTVPPPQEPASPPATCAKCGTPFTPGKKFCGICGAPAASTAPAASVHFCPACGKQVPAGKKFCGYCGHKMD